MKKLFKNFKFYYTIHVVSAILIIAMILGGLTLLRPERLAVIIHGTLLGLYLLSYGFAIYKTDYLKRKYALVYAVIPAALIILSIIIGPLSN